MNLPELKKEVEQKRGQLKQLQLERRILTNSLLELELEQTKSEEARAIIQLVAQQTQQKVQIYISDVVSSALETVLDDPYELIVEFVQRRNKTECDLLFSRNGFKVTPLDASGGGAINIATFALRTALLMLSKYDKIIIADEPLHFLHSKILHGRVAELISHISEVNNIQIIIVTGEETEEIRSLADKVFEVTKIRGVSNVSLVK
jgi:hypothetical protein